MDMDKLPDYMKDPNAVLSDDTEWIDGSAPDYSRVNALYEKEKTSNHVPGSMEELVSNLVKNWERESSHKRYFKDCRTMNLAEFKFGVNGNWFTADALGLMGNYNALIGECEYYAASRVPSFQESNAIFRTAMKPGFAWEVVELYSGPPKVAFKWRHWGQMQGEMLCPLRSGTDLWIKPSNKRLEFYGMTTVALDEEYRIMSVETFWNPDEMFKQIVH